MRIDVTGHMNFTDDTATLVADAIRNHLATVSGTLTGVSCLARGADSIFARVIIDPGGHLEVIMPSTDYHAATVKPDHAPLSDALIAKAANIRTLPFATANRDAYVAANQAPLDGADQLNAVWDEQPSSDRGSTAGVVAEPRDRGLDVAVAWPDGAAREQPR